MFASSAHRTQGTRRKAGLLAIASLLVTLALAAPLGAGASSTRVQPGSAIGKAARLNVVHMLWHPAKQVNAVRLSKATTAALASTSIDLHAYDPPPGNQGPLGSCVTWAIDYGLLGWYEEYQRHAAVTFDPMFTFAQVKTDLDPSGKVLIDPTTGQPFWHAVPTTVLASAAANGNDTQADDPGSVIDMNTQPTQAQKANALNYRIASYKTLFANTNDAGGGTIGAGWIEQALSNNQPVSIGLIVPADLQSGFYNGATYENDLADASPTEAHEVMADGYDANGVWILNSWGPSFGLKGRIELSWAVVEQDVFEAYTISGFADTTPPTLGPINESLGKGQSASTSAVPVTFSWTASDASGIAAYATYLKMDGGQWVRGSNLAGTALSSTYSLAAGHSWQFALTAEDNAGNWSALGYSITTTPSLFDDKSVAIVSPWVRNADSGSLFGTYLGTTTAGHFVSYPATGHDVALIAPRASSGASATLNCGDGSPPQTISEYSATFVDDTVIASCHYPQGGTHTITLSSTTNGVWTMMDAFAVLS